MAAALITVTDSQVVQYDITARLCRFVNAVINVVPLLLFISPSSVIPALTWSPRFTVMFVQFAFESGFSGSYLPLLSVVFLIAVSGSGFQCGYL